MSITLSGSNAASAITQRATAAMISLLREELTAVHDEYETPGVINVALFFEERLIPGGFAEDLNRQLTTLANDTLVRLNQYHEICREESWEDTDAKYVFLLTIQRLTKVLQSFIAKSYCQETVPGLN